MADHPLKKLLQDAVDKKRRAKDDAQYEQFAGEFARELGSRIPHAEISESVIRNLTAAIEPVLSHMLERDRVSTEDISRAVSAIQIQAPDINTDVIASTLREAFANFKIEAPVVNVAAPNVEAPVVHVAPTPVNFPDVMKVLLHEISPKQPLPVQMVDLKGKPWFPATSPGGGSSGPVVIRDMVNSQGFTLIDSTTAPGLPALRTTASLALTTSLDVKQLSGTADSVNVIGFSASVASVPTNNEGLPYNSDNPFPVTFSAAASQAVTLRDGYSSLLTSHNNVDMKGLDTYIINDNAIDVHQVSGAVDSVSIVSQTAFPVAQGDAASALRVILAGNSDASVVVSSGTITAVTSITNSVATSNIDSSGVQYSGSNPFPVYVAGNSANSIAVVALDRDGNPVIQGPIGQGDSATALRVLLANDIAYSVNIVSIGAPIAQGDAASALRVVLAGNSDSSVSMTSQTAFAVNQGDTGTNTLRIVQAGDSVSSVYVTGQADSMMTWQARTTNPTAKSDGADTRPMADKLGRGVTRPMQVRDLIATAYVTLSNGTEQTLGTAAAGAFLDPILITGTNTSTAAIQVDLRAVSGGNIVMTWMIPASTGPLGLALPVGWPQDATGNAWTADMGDFTNTNVYISALFSKEV